MKKIFVLAAVLVALTFGLSIGDLQVHKAQYLGNPRIKIAPQTTWHNYNGRGPQALSQPAVFLDSSANQNGIYVSRVNGTSANGNLIVGKVIRQMVPGSGWLENFTWTNGGNPAGTFTADPNVNSANYGRYPWSNFDVPDFYGFITASQVIGGAFAQPLYCRNSGGYGTGLWDTSVDIRPSGESYQNASGLWVNAVLPYSICVPMEATSTGIPLMSEVIDTLGNVVSDIQTVFDQYGGTVDCRNGKVAAFGGGPTDGMNLKTSIDGGVTYVPDSMGIWAFGSDSGWFEWQTVILQDASVGVLLTMDDVAAGHSWTAHNTPHGTLQFFMKNQPFPNKVTIFAPTMDQACTFPMISRKDDNTLVATFMYVESGWDTVAWAVGGTYWDIGESHSTDGGLTWSAVRNLTNTPTVSECCVQTAKHVGGDNKLNMTYGTAAVASDPVDIYWNVEFMAGAQETYNWYLRDSVATGVELQPSTAKLPASFELSAPRPNPVSGSTAIQYALPVAGNVTLSVYNAAGQLVKTLVSGRQEAGLHTTQWNAKGVPSGVYFGRLNAGSFTKTRTMVVVR